MAAQAIDIACKRKTNCNAIGWGEQNVHPSHVRVDNMLGRLQSDYDDESTHVLKDIISWVVECTTCEIRLLFI